MNDGGPAFPCEQVYMDDTPNARHSGMSLRDWDGDACLHNG